MKYYLVTVGERIYKTFNTYKVYMKTAKTGEERKRAIIDFTAQHFNYPDKNNLKITHITTYEFTEV